MTQRDVLYKKNCLCISLNIHLSNVSNKRRRGTHTHTHSHTHLYFTHYANFVYNDPFPRKSIRHFDFNLMSMGDIGMTLVAELAYLMLNVVSVALATKLAH